MLAWGFSPNKPMEPIMGSHTPGPWHRNIPPAARYPTVWSGRNKHVAYVKTSADLTPEEIEANITLIAAAPDLLEALKGCLPQLELGNCEAEHIKAAHAAIAKAESPAQ